MHWLLHSVTWKRNLNPKKDRNSSHQSRLIFFRRTAGYTLFDHRRNEEILEKLQAEPVDEKLRTYNSNWLRHVTRMNNRMPKIMLNYRPTG